MSFLRVSLLGSCAGDTVARARALCEHFSPVHNGYQYPVIRSRSQVWFQGPGSRSPECCLSFGSVLSVFALSVLPARVPLPWRKQRWNRRVFASHTHTETV